MSVVVFGLLTCVKINWSYKQRDGHQFAKLSLNLLKIKLLILSNLPMPNVLSKLSKLAIALIDVDQHFKSPLEIADTLFR